MALIKPIAPDLTTRALLAGVANFMDPRDPLMGTLLQAPRGLHVFTLGLRDITDTTIGIQGAKSAGWRFLAGSPLGPAVSGDVIQPVAGGAPKMTGVSSDPLVAAAIRAVNEVETLPEVQRQNYELQVLRIPGALIEAFWLKSQIAGNDLAVPLLTRSKQLQLMRAYPMDDFLGIVRALIPTFLEFDQN
jgi:hypothetical protein